MQFTKNNYNLIKKSIFQFSYPVSILPETLQSTLQK